MGHSAIDILDIGAGDGFLAGELLKYLPPKSRIVCWDTNYTDVDLASSALAGVTLTAHGPDRRFDVVLVLDVLEHIANDREFLETEVMPRLSCDGCVVVSVPIHPILFTEHDRQLGHLRRYRTRQIRSCLAEFLGIEIEGRLFSSLLPARASGKLLDALHRSRNVHGIGRWDGGPVVTRIVTAVLGADARFGRFAARHGFPTFGLSYWAVGRASAR